MASNTMDEFNGIVAPNRQRVDAVNNGDDNSTGSNDSNNNNNNNNNASNNSITKTVIDSNVVTELKEKYKKEFPATRHGTPTPIICACEKGRFEDVKVLITGYNDVNGSNGNNNNMTLKEYVNQVGKRSDGYKCTPLMAAAREEHFQIVKYLIEQGEADSNIARDSLHL